jgi:hypothetical protein
MSAKCVVCHEMRAKAALIFCGPCERSYDQALSKNGSIAHIIIWAAERSRKFAVLSEAKSARLGDGKREGGTT